MSSRTALVIGGTGTTGIHIINGLLNRGFDVTILHRGVHEPPDLPDIEHIHGDPHFPETLTEALAGREFDVIVATYGRLRVVAEVVAHRCGQFVGTTSPSVYENLYEPYTSRPSGLKVLISEDGPYVDDHGPAAGIAGKILAAERAVFDQAAAGAYQGTILRYPKLYGPRDVVPLEWSVIKRVRDGRPYMLVTDGGHDISFRCAAQNGAHAVLLAVDRPHVADGKAYNCGDTDQFTLRQWIEMVTDILEAQLDIVSIPREIGEATHAELHQPGRSPHSLLDTSLIRRELGYQDQISARDATRAFVEWLEANPPNRTDFGSYVDAFDYEAEDRLVTAYRAAVALILGEVPRAVPERRHPLPHPKAPGRGRDQSQR